MRRLSDLLVDALELGDQIVRVQRVRVEPDGAELRVRGCDLFEFEGDLIRTKNAFRKQLGS